MSQFIRNTTRKLPRAAITVSALAIAGCGGGGGGSSPSALSSPASASLDIDFANLPDYATPLPAYYDANVAALDNAPANVTPTPQIATLGRVLFNDKRLSINDAKACASCHDQSRDLADNSQFSLGFAGTDRTTAHAMRLANLRYWKPGSMFWDRRAPTLEAQSVMPLQHPVEMGFDEAHGGMQALIGKMQAQPYYAQLFTQAFGDAAITQDRIQEALAQFLRGMVSVNSRWDAGYAQAFDPSLPDKGLDKPLSTLSDEENRGRHLFMAFPSNGGLACAACHMPPTFALKPTSGSNGLDAGETRLFKSPSLKNVGQSSNFMHDGRFSTLEEVVDHYASGVKDGPALDVNLKDANGVPRVRDITPEDKAALVAFLKTLSDPVLAADPRFANPFRP